MSKDGPKHSFHILLTTQTGSGKREDLEKKHNCSALLPIGRFSFHICIMEERLKKSLLQMMITAIALLVGDYLMDSVRFQEPWVAIITAIILGLLNTFLRPLLILLTIPVTLFTLGLFLLFINAIMLVLTDHLVDGFQIDSFMSAFLLSIFISLVNTVFGARIKVVRQRPDDHFDPHEEL